MQMRRFKPVQLNADDIKKETQDFESAWFFSYCLLVADSENFIIQTCNQYLPQVKDTALRKNLKLCFAQEGQHSSSHTRAFSSFLRGNKLMSRFLKISRYVNYQGLVPILPLSFRLAVAASMEQLNSHLAYYGLQRAQADENTPLAQMLRWHFVEEIEHREVVFDLLKTIGVSRWTKNVAMVFTLSSFILWITLGATLWKISSTQKYLRRGSFLLPIVEMISAAKKFFGRQYHPSQDILPARFFTAQAELG